MFPCCYICQTLTFTTSTLHEHSERQVHLPPFPYDPSYTFETLHVLNTTPPPLYIAINYSIILSIFRLAIFLSSLSSDTEFNYRMKRGKCEQVMQSTQKIRTKHTRGVIILPSPSIYTIYTMYTMCAMCAIRTRSLDLLEFACVESFSCLAAEGRKDGST